jgi:hypothetical protein
MSQMTDVAFAEAQSYCIVHHTVLENGCLSDRLYSRVVPSHATELTAVFLDRNVTAILGHCRKRKISRQQREELAAVIHLCGAGPATAFAQRGFRLMPGEHCGDHDVAAYLVQIKAMKREFLRLADRKVERAQHSGRRGPHRDSRLLAIKGTAHMCSRRRD